MICIINFNNIHIFWFIILSTILFFDVLSNSNIIFYDILFNQTHLYLFRANMTHVLQCLDVCCFGTLKREIQILSHHWHGRPENAAKKLDKYSMMKHCAYEAIQKVFSNPEVVKSGFRKTGIFPWDKNQPDVRKLNAGSIYRHEFVQEASTDAPTATAPSTAATTVAASLDPALPASALPPVPVPPPAAVSTSL